VLPISDSELLEALLPVAVAAGRAAYAVYLRGDAAVEYKADRTPVTEADHAAETVILAGLARIAPDVPVVAEEACAAGHVPTVGATFFLVDPLDGTKEFIGRRTDFTVNIALIRSGVPVLGVVYAPAGSMLYAGDAQVQRAFRCTQPAEPRSGAAGSRQRLRVRAAPEAGLTAVVSRSHATPATEAYLQSYGVRERVSVGSSLKFCLIAAGEADLYPRLGPTMEWDTAAGHAVLVAAGGQVSAPAGVPLRYGKPGFRNSFFVAGGPFPLVPLAA
jgi:3'(2'), 5'-bisphosphate nucleotidase